MTNAEITELGFKVLRQRRERNWTQSMLAARANVSLATITRLERGRHVPDMATVERVSRALGLTLTELLQGAA